MNTFIALLAVVCGEGHASARPACLVPSGAAHARCGELRPSPPASDLLGTYAVYRVVGRTSDVRRCRLTPTCSLFASQAFAADGWLGLLLALARVQMEHGSQGGLLPARVGADDAYTYDDPLDSWHR